MKFVKKEARLINPSTYRNMLEVVELAARNCYNSRKGDDPEKFIRGLIKRGHESPLEFGNITVELILSRSDLAQLTRHRLASYCCQSQRYVKYTDGVSFIVPAALDVMYFDKFKAMCQSAEDNYLFLLNGGNKAEVARAVLPQCTATDLYMSANIREWRHILKLRTKPSAQDDIRILMQDVLRKFNKMYPVFFEDI